MANSTERRCQRALAAAIDHAIELKASHGVSFAWRYLCNQQLREDTMRRVLNGGADIRHPVDQPWPRRH